MENTIENRACRADLVQVGRNHLLFNDRAARYRKLPGLLLGVLLALICVLDTVHCLAEGIEKVAVGTEELTFTISGFKSGVPYQLIEYRPYEDIKTGGNVAWSGSASEQFSVPRYRGQCDRLFNRFQLVHTKTGEQLGTTYFVDDLSALPTPRHPLIWPEEIKGVSCPVHLNDLNELGIRHVHINITPSWAFLDDPTGNEESQYRWTVDGETFAFDAAYINSIDAQVSRMTQDGVNVVAVVMLKLPRERDADNPLIHPRTDLENAPHAQGGFNLSSEAGLRHYIAFMQYMAHRYSQQTAPHGHITGYIIGNEIDTHWMWHNLGRISLDKLVRQHADELRLAYYAVRSQHPDISVYTSLTHCWNVANLPDPKKSVRGRELLEKLNVLLSKEGNIPWNIAFHPYPQDLFEPRFWNDHLAMFGYDTPKITLKNIEVLVDYVNQERFLFRGKRRQIILSEQGFHAGETKEDERVQAAAYALAYHRLKQLPEIDAFILHRHVDHRHEGGLKLGLWTADSTHASASHPERKRQLWDVVQAAGTEHQAAEFAFALSILGIESWDESAVRQGPFPEHAPEWNQSHAGEEVLVNLVARFVDAKVRRAADWRLVSQTNTDRESELAILHHPQNSGPTTAEFQLEVSGEQPLVFAFDVMRMDARGDGVEYSASVDGHPIWQEVRRTAKRESYQIPLPQSVEGKLRLSLKIDPLGNSAYDQALWISPRILVPKSKL